MKSNPKRNAKTRLGTSNQLSTKALTKLPQIGLAILFSSVLFYSIQQTESINASSYSIADDQDQDDIPNWEDFDDDNDGIEDQFECNPDQVEIFTYTGSDQIANIPTGTETIKAKIWGAGGRGDQRSGRGTGGAGGYTEIEIPLSALPGGTTQLVVTVGEGGNSSTGSVTYGNGGAGFINTSGNGHNGRNAGSGGGMSALSLVTLAVPASVSVSELIAIAGGGGTMPAYSSSGTYAGEGGGTNGGDEKAHPTQGGGGGSQVAGGTAVNNGNPGSFLQGGNAVNNGGGGGGGFYGGASGNFADPCGTCTSSADEHGGGGGSGYVNPAATSSSMETGNLQTPPNTSDPDYIAGVGVGGDAGSGGVAGGNGLVVITYVFALDCDLDQDGIPNHLDLDSDGDGITDIIEAGGTDPDGDGQVEYATPGDPMTLDDSDGDGLSDVMDNVDSGSGVGEFTSGTPLTLPNTDGSGQANFRDIDSDDDGIVDYTEAQATATHIARSNVDTDGDGLDDAFDIDCQPCGAISGTAIVPWNTGNTADADYMDLDSDGDGNPDSIEGHDTNGDGVVDGSDSPMANTGLAGGTTDIDGDGLLDGYDNDTNPVNFDATNGSMLANSHPNTNGLGSEMDWREQFVFPVEWLDFAVEKAGVDAKLSWATASEQNSDYFQVERSFEGTQFEEIGQVNAAGTTSNISQYQFTDPNITFYSNAKLLYRLKQVDLDGAVDYSKTIELTLGDSEQEIFLTAYPNPVKDVLRIRMSFHGAASLKIINNAAQVVYHQDLSANETGQDIRLAVSEWPAGFYQVILESDFAQTYKKIMKN